MTQADLDGDGHVDLIVGNYFPDGARILDAAGAGVESMPDSLSRAYNGGRKHLFLWEGAGGGPEPSVRFREVKDALDEEVARGWTFGIGAADLDGDLLPEVYFVHDWGPDRLLHNRSQPGRLRFARLVGERTMTTPRSKVLGGDSFNGMGMDFGDLNGDGRPDLVVSNITAAYGLHESHFAFLSTGQVGRMQVGDRPVRRRERAARPVAERLGLGRPPGRLRQRRRPRGDPGRRVLEGDDRSLARGPGAGGRQRRLDIRPAHLGPPRARRRDERRGPQPLLRPRRWTGAITTSPRRWDWTRRCAPEGSPPRTWTATAGWTTPSPISGVRHSCSTTRHRTRVASSGCTCGCPSAPGRPRRP